MSADNRLDFEEELVEYLTNEVNETNARRLDDLSRTHSREMARVFDTPLFQQIAERYASMLYELRKRQRQDALNEAKRAQEEHDRRIANRSWLRKATVGALRWVIDRLIDALNYLVR